MPFFVGMSTAHDSQSLKPGNELLLKFRAGTNVDSIVQQLAAVCPGARTDDTQGFAVILGSLQNLTQKEYSGLGCIATEKCGLSKLLP